MRTSVLRSIDWCAALERCGFAIDALRCAGELGQRTEGRRIEVAVGLVWSVVEVALPSGHKVRLRRGGWRCLHRPPMWRKPRVCGSVDWTMKVTATAPPLGPLFYIAHCSSSPLLQSAAATV